MQYQPQKQHSSFKDLYRFMRRALGIRSKDPQQRAEAIRQTTDDLRSVAKPENKMQVDTFEDIMKDIDEVLRGLSQNSVPDKRIAGGFLAFNLVLLPVILA